MIYTLTTMIGDKGEAINGKRSWGFYHSEKKALRAIRHNFGDMDDCLYDYLVMEEYKPGVVAIAEREVWFEWASIGELSGTWIECGKPKFSEGLVNWAMG